MTRTTMRIRAPRTPLDVARAKYRRAYDRGYRLSERGDYEQAQRILDRANREYEAAKARLG